MAEASPDPRSAPPRGWHHTWWGARLIALAALLLRAFLAVIAATYRLELRGGVEHLEAARREKRPTILSFWHNRSLIGARFVLRELVAREYEVVVLASQSRDGELVAQLAQRLGLDVVRGSASRGGRDAVRALYRALTRRGASPVMIPDGPRGPLYRAKVGVVVLAQLAQAPILPLGMAAGRALRIGSWDRLIVPWPFARVVVVVGEPRSVAKGSSSEDLEAERRALETALDELTLAAEAAVGFEDVLRSRDGA